MVAYYTAH
ncbi:hypothetical protein LINGRAHAP2_LOCUS13496 [Linum grandiflorum]